MEKILNPYDMEYMKMAMLKHEETFKQQLYELHRLYKTQKILMKGTRKQKRAIREGGGGDESELELTLGPSCYHRRSGKNTTFSSSSSSLSFSSTEELKWGVDELPEAFDRSFHGGGQNRPNVEDVQQFGLNNSPWHFQALSLNMTS
ncbi:unnamed protein product [Cuscuta campestris]|uniref:Uncharacterized protein n=2 Tax=Cuscuta sect. Cleistogrammica TaxID=1824901 RepID=A0A484K849_9ASTE|nr:hypothetical protein DM860_008433 [Cuscuta australis]VFQ58352.1 unnamed protein product [Cuscuta campestris]